MEEDKWDAFCCLLRNNENSIKIPRRFYRRYGNQLNNEQTYLVDPKLNPVSVKLSFRVNNAVCTAFLEGMNITREIYEVDHALCILFKFVTAGFFRVRIFKAQLHHEELDYSIYSNKLRNTHPSSASSDHFVSCFKIKITKPQSTGSHPLAIRGTHASDWFPIGTTHAPVLTADGGVKQWKVVRVKNDEVFFTLEWYDFLKESGVRQDTTLEFLYSTHWHVFKIMVHDT